MNKKNESMNEEMNDAQVTRQDVIENATYAMLATIAGFDPTDLSGYHLVTFSTYTSSTDQSMLNSVPQADGRFAVRLHNHLNSTQTIKIYIRCLYEKIKQGYKLYGLKT